MMCDVMPTISEDSISQRSSQFSGEDANFEQLMVSMLDERDKLMDSLRETQERLGETEAKLADVEKERDSLQRQISANLPQVGSTIITISRSHLMSCPCTRFGALLIPPRQDPDRHFSMILCWSFRYFTPVLSYELIIGDSSSNGYRLPYNAEKSAMELAVW